MLQLHLSDQQVHPLQRYGLTVDVEQIEVQISRKSRLSIDFNGKWVGN